ncbi:hypothetical protein GCK72_008916 [Caenorhabditis remanei]|uniref:Uncharacterized protein n=1 Tax=Caenorhabditis remanei TaxID=31234 RepID=A0A6A5H010_CAERE|nr:hypothetical protein GCK72_008916 [Caenorhabditis remanei]KAF1760667.1 hypothetical protein GCK72_008916 [Caenorhabditis remanei]
MHQPNTKKVLISGYIQIDAKRQRSYEIDKNELLERLLITIFLLVVVCGGLHLFGIAYNHHMTAYSEINEEEKLVISVEALLGIVIIPGFLILVFLSKAISRRKQAKLETNEKFRGKNYYYILSPEENTTLNRLEYGICSVVSALSAIENS